MTDTWGISGPLFLAGYALAGLLALAVVLIARNLVKNSAEPRSPGWQLHSSDALLAAHLNGGAELALLTALGSLRAVGQVRSQGYHCVRVAGAEPGRLPELERAILAELADPATRAELAGRAGVATALAALRQELTDRALLLSGAQRTRMRRTCLPFVVLLLIGVLRLLAGAQHGRPVALLVVLLVPMVFAVPWFLLRVPVRTPLGDDELARLRWAHHNLRPALKPSWTAHGPSLAALGIAVFGTEALWSGDPQFAGALAASRSAYGEPSVSSGAGGASGFFGCGGGGGSGCGGGSGGGGGCGG